MLKRTGLELEVIIVNWRKGPKSMTLNSKKTNKYKTELTISASTQQEKMWEIREVTNIPE